MKMLELIKKKQGGGRSKNGNSKNDRKTCAKGLKFLIINKRLSVKLSPINKMGDNFLLKHSSQTNKLLFC